MRNKSRQTLGILLTVILFSGSVPISFGDMFETGIPCVVLYPENESYTFDH